MLFVTDIATSTAAAFTGGAAPVVMYKRTPMKTVTTTA
jgi:hypothetical protein